MEKKDKIDYINYKFDDYIAELLDIRKQYTNPKYKAIYDRITGVVRKMIALYNKRLSYKEDNEIWFEVNEIRVNY